MSSHTHHEHESYTKTIFGFWVYLMTDFMMFATLFAVFAILRHSYFGGPHPSELFSIPYTFVQTGLLFLAAFYKWFRWYVCPPRSQKRYGLGIYYHIFARAWFCCDANA